jgi:hypothetical protein
MLNDAQSIPPDVPREQESRIVPNAMINLWI